MRNNIGLLLAKRAALSPNLEGVVEVERGRRVTFAEYESPKAVRFTDEIPRNPAGKILKRVLRAQFPEPAAE